jgi:dethiobiotin synthetase
VPGLFITGTDTDVGKTYVAALIAGALRASGRRVGVYKPAASGCVVRGESVVAVDALALWEAAGRPGALDRVCPQRFLAPLAPHLAARDEGKTLEAGLLRAGIEYWRERSDIVIVEGSGGLMSPLGEEDYVADLAAEFGYPLVVVAANRIGVINHVLQTLIAAAAFGEGLPVAGIVLNDTSPAGDMSRATNHAEIAARAVAPVLGTVAWDGQRIVPDVEWWTLAGGK